MNERERERERMTERGGTDIMIKEENLLVGNYILNNVLLTKVC